MKSTDAPSKQAVPFGSNGPREAITATTPSGSNQASYDQGFPPITMTLKSAGGLPPKGQDMNQILFEHSSFNRFFSAGGGYPFDAAFATAIGGYPKGAIVPFSDFTGSWLNLTDENSINPENSTASLTGWVPAESYGVTSISGLSASGVTVGTKDASRDRIILSGNLTANVNVVLPAWVKYWQITNNCTGSFAVTVKTAAGSGAVIPNGYTYGVFGDGVSISLDARGQYARVNGDVANDFAVRNSGDTNNAVNNARLDFRLSQYAALVGSSSQVFNVANGTASSHAINLGQLNSGLSLKADVSGNQFTPFNVGGATTATQAVRLDQFQSGNNTNGAWTKLPNGPMWARTNISLVANGSTTWTFPITFPGSPGVYITNFNSGNRVWLNGIGPGSVGIYNDGAAMNINIFAIW